METEYTVDYFLEKFEAIPESAWCAETYMGQYRNWLGRKRRDLSVRCAQGHCMTGVELRKNGFAYSKNSDDELNALRDMFGYLKEGIVTYYRVALVNNGQDPRYQQPTPKQRILAALRDIKAKQDVNDAVEVAKKAVDDFMDFAKEVKALKEPKREIVYVKLEVETTEANPN